MGTRRTRVCVRAAAVATTAASVAVVGPAQAGGVRAHWGFTETGSPPAVAADDSGNGNDGTPSGGVVGNGSAFTFDGSGLVVVDDSPSLNPGTAGFSYTVTFTTALPASGTDFDVLRKGFTKTAGGEYKVEILDVKGAAKGFCLVKDSQKHVGRIRFGRGDLADGQVHTITCTKTSTGISIAVDGSAPRTKAVSGGLGSVSNSASLVLGAKAASGGDWFEGSLLDASVQ